MSSTCDEDEYVKSSEEEEEDIKCIPNLWMVVRIEGKNFGQFTEIHNFNKPYDERGLELMTEVACHVMEEFQDICLAYGHSAEYNFVIRKDSTIYNRQSLPITKAVKSLFASKYVSCWDQFMLGVTMTTVPCFDSHIMAYPLDIHVQDYLCLRQAELETKNVDEMLLKGIMSKLKYTKPWAEKLMSVVTVGREILLRQIGINYDDEPDIYKYGTTLMRKLLPGAVTAKQCVISVHCDLSTVDFWDDNGEVLSLQPLQPYKENSAGKLRRALTIKIEKKDKTDTPLRKRMRYE